MPKLRLDEINWKEIRDAFSAHNPNSGKELIGLREAMPEMPVYLLTEDFTRRCVEYGNTMGGSPDTMPLIPETVRTNVIVQINTPTENAELVNCTLLVASPNSLVIFPLPEGGMALWNADRRAITVPDAFAPKFGAGKEGLQNYGNLIDRFTRTAFAMLELPELVRYRPIAARRVVRKGKVTREREYNLVTIYPASERLVAQRVRSEPEEGEKTKRTMAEHYVGQVWARYGLDPECDHEFEDITTDEVLKRERCLHCEGKRTLRRGFRRGDPNKPKLRRVIQVK